MKNIICEVETCDPDDFMMICFLCSHPESNLLAINITPGSNDQVGLIRALLNKLNKKVLIGVRKINYDKSCVSEFHNKIIEFKPELPDGTGADITNEIYSKYPDAIYVSGSPSYNLKAALEQNKELKIPLFIQQGGFISNQYTKNPLKKFEGIKECQSANINDKVLVNYLLNSTQIDKKVFVSKNICHGVIYNDKYHEILKNIDRKPALNILFNSMGIYLQGRKDGKAFHDPLAASYIFDESICEFLEGNLYRKEGKWGFAPQSGTNTFISIDVDEQKFIQTLFKQ